MSNVFVFRQPPQGFINEYSGGGGKGGSTTVSQVQIPPEVLARYNAVNARAETVAQQPYQAYSNDPNAFVAPLTDTQVAGIQNTNIMAGAAQPYYNAATEQLMQAQQQGQAALNPAYQNISQAQDLGRQYAGAAGQQYGQAQNIGNQLAGAANQQYGQAQQTGQGYLGAATLAGLAGAQSVDPSRLNMGQFMNPYTQSVVNATQAAMNQQQGQQLSQQQAEAIRSGAFGGERAGLQRGQLMGQQGLAQAQAIAPLYQQNYNQALAAAQQQQGVGLGAQQANRAAVQNYAQQLGLLGQQGYGQALGVGQAQAALGQQQYGQALGVGQAQAALGQQQYGQGMTAAQQLAALGQQGYNMGAGTSAALAGLGTNAQQAGLAGAQAQLQAGQVQQQTQQAGLQALYNQFQQQQGYPFQVAQYLAGIAEGTGGLSGNQTTQTTTGGGGFFSSDKRLKENIEKVGKTNDGQPIYRYNYKGDPNTQMGLLAQDVEKKHPEAVGLAGGYKTVNYKKATEDAVHKADGGAATDAYAITPDTKSQMLSGLALPQMITGPQHIERGADAAGLAAMRAPLVNPNSEDERAGLSLGTLAGKRAELASLGSSAASGNGAGIGSGPGYVGQRSEELRKFLAPYEQQYASAGGLVGPEGGAFAQGGSFARGGLAFGGVPDYTHPWFLANQAGGASKTDMMNAGPWGVAPRQPSNRQLLQGAKIDRPPQRNAIDEATKIGQLGSTASSAWGARPDFLRSDADVAARKQTADAIRAKELIAIEQAKGLGAAPAPAPAAEAAPTRTTSLDEVPLPTRRPDERVLVTEGYGEPSINGYEDLPIPAAHGGMIERHHYANTGYVSTDNPYDTGEGLGAILTKPQPEHPLMKGGEMPRPPQQQSGVGQLAQGVGTLNTANNVLNKGKEATQWAAKQLSGEASPTAMSATSTEAAPTGLAAGTNAVPAAETAGVAGGAPIAETAKGIAGATPELLSADAADAAAAAAGATGDLAVTSAVPEVVAPVMTAAAEIPWWEAIPFLLKDGGSVPRRHYQTAGSVPENGNFPDRVPEGASSRFGTDVGTEMTDEEKANALKVLAGQTLMEKAPLMERRQAPAPKPEVPVEAPAAEQPRKPLPARPAIGETGPGRSPIKHLTSGLFPDSINPDTKAALTSENLWVPALAGIGSMLASPNKTLAGAVGSGLVGGTTAYTGLQKQQSGTDLERAQEREILGKAAKGSVEYTNGFPTAVFVSDGKGGMVRMPFIEAYRNRKTLSLLPETLSEVEGLAKAYPELVAGVETTKAPAAPAAPIVPAPPAPVVEKPKVPPVPGEKPKTTEAAPATTEEAPSQQTGAIVTSNEGGDYRYAVEPKKNGAADKYFGSTLAFKGVNLQDPQEVQTVIQSDQNLSERAKNDAKIAEDIRKQIPTINRNMADLHTLSSSINKIGDKGFTQRGAGQESRAALANLYNTTARVMGIPNMQMIDANSDISNTEIINKIQSLSSPEIAKGAGFHAAGIADSIRNAMPGGRLTLEAANTILASMYSEMQKMRDFDKYYDAQTRRYGTGLNAYGNFTNDMAGVYAKEKEAIKKALMAHDVVPKEGEKYRQSYADVVRKDPRSSVQLDKMFKSPGFARYWSDN